MKQDNKGYNIKDMDIFSDKIEIEKADECIVWNVNTYLQITDKLNFN